MTTAPALVLNNPIVEIDVIEQQGDPIWRYVWVYRPAGGPSDEASLSG